MKTKSTAFVGADELIAAARVLISKRGGKSAWARGVGEYAEELCYEIGESGLKGFSTESELLGACLNGADDWTRYSESGNSLVWTADIADRLLPPSKRGRLSDGEAVRIQADALREAFARIIRPAFAGLVKKRV